jgi:hypothetical protein
MKNKEKGREMEREGGGDGGEEVKSTRAEAGF